LSFSQPFLWFAAFRTICWFCGFFFLLDDILELFFGFWSSSCASCVLDSKFKLCVFVVNVLIKGEIENPSDQ
jgi:hypothetical protein